MNPRERKAFYDKRRRALNHDQVLGAEAKRRVNRYRQIKEFVKSLKAITPCADCGKHFGYWVMEFDHVKGDKKFDVSRIGGRSMAVIKAEVAKCEIVCSNCHKDREHVRLISEGGEDVPSL